MTNTTNSRIAGFTFLFYIAIGIAAMILFDRISGGHDQAARLANIAQHIPQMRVVILITFGTAVCALTLGVALYGLTRDTDRDLAVLALSCRITEGVINAIGTVAMLALLSIATSDRGSPIGSALLRFGEWSTLVGATLFAIGSTIYSVLFVRARTIPRSMAWLGVI